MPSLLGKPRSIRLSVPARIRRRHWPLAVVAFAVLLVAYRALIKDNSNSDFRYFYVAGHLWWAGMDPYDTALFRAFGPAFFGPANGGLVSWVYPPQWVSLALPLSWLPYPAAADLWAAINLTALLTAAALFYRNARTQWAALLVVIWSLTGEPAREVFYWGQSSAIVALGAAVLCVGIINNRKRLQAVGLAITFLKPQVGLVYLAVMAWHRPRVAATALGISALMALPVVLLIGPDHLLSMLGNYLGGLKAYSRAPENLPQTMTGIGVLVDLPIAPLTYSLIAAISAPIVAKGLVRSGAPMERALILSSTAAILFLVPMHTNDFLLAMPLAALAANFEGKPRMLLVAALLLLYRPWDLAMPWYDPSGTAERRAIIEAVGGCFAAAAVAWQTFLNWPPDVTGPSSERYGMRYLRRWWNRATAPYSWCGNCDGTDPNCEQCLQIKEI